MNKLFSIILGALFFSTFFISCSSEPIDAPLGQWQLVFFELDGNVQQIFDATLACKEENNVLTFVGFTGVNNYSGTIIRNNNKLKANDDFITTKMAGPTEAMEFEKKFLSSLTGTTTYTFSEFEGRKELIISSKANKSILKFEKFSIIHSKWNLNAVASDNGTISIYQNDYNKMPSLSFESTNTISGFSGINTFQLNYTIDEINNKIKFNAGVTTLAISGEENINLVEGLFLQRLNETVAYVLSDKTLTFYNDNNETILFFEKQELVK